MKPRLKVLNGNGVVEVSKIDSLMAALRECPAYMHPKLFIREDPYFKHLFKAFPSETLWIVIKPSEGWIFWNQVAFKTLKYIEAEKLIPFMLDNYDRAEFVKLVRELQGSPDASLRIAKLVGDFDGFAKALLKNPKEPLEDYKIYLVDPTSTKEVSFFERDGYWMFLKAKRYL